MLHILLEVFGGLGLFFVGINLLSDSIKQLGSGYAPKIIHAFSQNDFRGALSGLASGVVTSSGKAVTFSLVALVEMGHLNFRRSLPIIMGGSIGSAFIVLWASFDFEVLIFTLMILAGVLYQFGDQKNPRLKLITGVILGFALLFYGLELMKMGAAPLKAEPWFNDAIHASAGHWMLALAIGTALSFLTQSGSSVAIVAISLVDAGLLGVDEAIMLAFGTNIGSGIITAMLGLGFKGVSRQLVFFHGFFKIIGVVVMVPMMYVETYLNVPFLKHFVAYFSNSPSTQIALIYLLYEVVTGVFVGAFINVVARWMERLPDIIAGRKEKSEPVPAEGLKHTLSGESVRVAVAYAEGDDIKSLISILQENNLSLVACKPMNSDWRKVLTANPVDVLIFNLDENSDQYFGVMEDLLEELDVPVLFNDGSLLRTSEDAAAHNYREQLAEKLLGFSAKGISTAVV